MTKQKVKFSIDRGGTFTDVYAEFSDGRTAVLKLLSDDPSNYADAPREGIRRILEREQGSALAPEQLSAATISSIRMGTTVATNALLERKGAKTALVISRGFADLLQIGNQTRPELFALNSQRPLPLYSHVIEANERVRPALVDEVGTVRGSTGRNYVVVEALDLKSLFIELELAKEQGCTSVAVVLAHGYAYPDHENLIGHCVAKVGFDHCSLSHQVMPAIRMVPRGDTTVVNAYLTPHVQRYGESFCAGFTDGLAATELLFMASDGGLVTRAAFDGSRALLSGPVGGGAGAGPTWHGCSGVHSHMTNTRITDVEVLENRYPIMVRQFGLRASSGGTGLFRGGDGLVRELEFLQPLQAKGVYPLRC